MIKDVGASDLLLSKEYVKKPVENICKLIQESDSKKIILSGGRGTGKSVVLCNLENQNNFIYMKFDPIQMFKLDDVFDEKFFKHYYEMIFMKKLLLYIKQNYRIIYEQYFTDFEELYSDVVNYTTKYINNSRYESASIGRYLSSTEISGEILEKLKNEAGINSLNLAIDRFDWTNGADELSQVILNKYFCMFDKILVTSDDESLDRNSKRRLTEKGYSFVNVDYGKKISIIKQIVSKRIESYNQNINHDCGEKYFPLSIMEKSIYENLIEKANGNISLIIDCLRETIETYNFKGNSFNPEKDFDIEMDIQINHVKKLRKMDGHKPKLYL